MNKKPIVLFFSRDYQSKFFPELVSEKYDSIHVTLSLKEKKNVEDRGGKVVGCLEAMYDDLEEAVIKHPYLDHSIGSDRYIVGHSHQERLRILKKCVTFWRSIFDEHQPNFIVNEVVALEISEILSIEARNRGIRYLAFGAFPVKKSFYWHENPFHSSMPEKLKTTVPSAQDIADAQAYIDKINTGPIDNPYIKEYKLGKDVARLKELIKHLLYTVYIILKVRNKVIRQLCYGSAINYYFSEIKYYFLNVLKSGSYDKMSDLEESADCVFYPMHFEPEATLFYMSTYYDNQFALVENLLKCLPEDQFLLIKEHPAQAGYLMQRNWRKLKNRFPNLRLINAEVPSKEIIMRSKTIVTLVSTAGFESTILGKQVIVLGKVYFDAYEGANYCATFEEVYDLIRGIKPFNKRESPLTYLAKILAIQNPGNPWPHDGLYSDQNKADIRQAIEKELA